jgi:hypothetical protein
MVTLQLRQLEVPPGRRLLIRDVDWIGWNDRLSLPK